MFFFSGYLTINEEQNFRKYDVDSQKASKTQQAATFTLNPKSNNEKKNGVIFGDVF